MPPKEAPRARARERGGGRGRRGRGRGVSTATATPDTTSSAQPTDPPSQSTSAASDLVMPDALAPALALSTPDATLMEVDPNDSPASQPTETPAPTPVRPAVQPAILLSSSTSTSSTAPGAKAKKESRFKPKAVQRSEQRQKELDQLELEYQKKLAAERKAEQPWIPRGGAWRSRGRGDAMGRGRITSSGSGGGLFGGTWESEGSLSRGGPARVGGSGGRGGTSRSDDDNSAPRSGAVKKEDGPRVGTSYSTKTYTSHNGIYLPDPRYPDEEDDTPRVDIEKINEDSDDEYDTSYESAKGRGRSIASRGGMKPVFLARVEHIDRISRVNIEPAAKAEPGLSEKDDDVVMINERHSSEVSIVGEATVQVKMEPDESMSDALLSQPMKTGEGQSIQLGSPVLKKPKLHHQSKSKDVKPVLQTEEDKAEWARHVEDVSILSQELGGLLAQSRDTEGDVVMEGETQTKDGRAYIFQFPPVLPTLYDPLKTEKPLPPSFKPSIKTEEDDVKVVRLVDKKPVDLTKGKPKDQKNKEIIIKKEEVANDREPKRIKDMIVTDEGRIGKLTIRKSGRVVMKWGGTRLVLGRGATSTFLTLGMVVDHPEAQREAEILRRFEREQAEKDKLEGGKGRGVTFKLKTKEQLGSLGLSRASETGNSMCMGQVMGKFTVTPEWSKI